MQYRRKGYSHTDIPDGYMNEALGLILEGEIRADDLESPQRIVARTLMIEREAAWTAYLVRALPAGDKPN